ncbi:hypothetical protein F5Y11DRAFT_328953 [Daldinia sp. FL1419]|nr:hypothetical protein F5Y11DRAFT_328953 [Daldinia sp. FL1419]
MVYPVYLVYLVYLAFSVVYPQGLSWVRLESVRTAPGISCGREKYVIIHQQLHCPPFGSVHSKPYVISYRPRWPPYFSILYSPF